MEEIKNEEIVKVSETETKLNGDRTNSVNREKREFRPRTPRPPRKENSEASQENGSNGEQAYEKKPYKKKNQIINLDFSIKIYQQVVMVG